MKKTRLSNERILKSVTASNAFEGLKPSKTSDELCRLYINGKLSGEEALKIIKQNRAMKV